MMAQAQIMQESIIRMQEELEAERIEGTAAGGLVKAVVSGQGELKEINISPEVVDPDDVEMLEDTILAAIRDAVERSRELSAEKMQGMGMPGGLGGLL